MVELENLRTANRAMEVKQRKYDGQISEERAHVAKAVADRDNLAQEIRIRETKVIFRGFFLFQANFSLFLSLIFVVFCFYLTDF